MKIVIRLLLGLRTAIPSTGGGDKDPADVEWNEPLGRSIRFADLQAFQVVYLKALRDVQQELRNSRFSPLGRIIEASDISEDDKNGLVDILNNRPVIIIQYQTYVFPIFYSFLDILLRPESIMNASLSLFNLIAAN